MTTFKVNVNKLNVRSSPVTDFDNTENVVSVLLKDAVFTSVGMLENELGSWPVNIEGHTVSEKFLSQLQDDIPPELIKYHDKIPKIFLDFHLGKLWELPMQKGLKVGIIDNGVDENHPALKRKVINLNEEIVINKISNPNHATTMACIIAGDDPENGIIGIAPNIDFIYSFTLPDHGANPEMFISALDKMEKEEIKIINISYGEYNEDFRSNKALQEKISDCAKNGCFIICSSGNGSVHDKTFYPASYDDVLSVTGILANYKRDISSNFWSGISICMCTDYYFDETKFKDSNATSSATAIISGCLAHAYNIFIEKENSLNYINSLTKALDKVKFEYHSLSVMVPVLEGNKFYTILKSTT